MELDEVKQFIADNDVTLKATRDNGFSTEWLMTINGKEYEAKYKVGNIPYTNVPDGIMDFTITNIQYTGQALCLTGVINPYRLPEKAAHFVYTAKGKTAQYAISSIMEQLDDVFADVYKAQKEYWFVMRRFDSTLEAPVYKTPIKNMFLNQTFTVEAKHYKGFLQLDFATYRFQDKIKAAEKLSKKALDPQAAQKKAEAEQAKIKASSLFMEEVKSFNPKYNKKTELELKEFNSEESLRLLYVAITRAQKKLYITTSAKAKAWGGKEISQEASIIFENIL